MALRELRQEIASAINEDVNNIKMANSDWVSLMKEGVIVKLHIGRWRAKTSLSWSDLGIELTQTDDRELQSIINLGHKKLLPADMIKRLDTIESKARKLLEKKSYKTHWGFFVPVTAYVDFKAELNKHIDDYFSMRDEIVNNYETIRQTVLISYEIAARSAYYRLRALHPEALSRFADEEDFARSFLANIEAHIELPEMIRRSFYFKIDLEYIPLPSLMAQEELEKERLYRQNQEEAESLANQQRLERERVWAEEEKLQAEVRAAQTEADKKEAMLEAMNRDIVEQTRIQKETQIDGFLKDVTSQLRSLVYKATTDVLGAIQKKDGLPPRSVVQLKNMIDQVASLNFYGDTEIDLMLKRVELQLNQDNDNRDIGQIENNLRNIATITRSSLIDLGESPRRARNLGIGDSPSQEVIRLARREIGLDVEVEGLDGQRQARMI